jgi:hypothetical protein
MKVYSYVLARDFGFAPNPFHGVCTLATCKPVLRRVAAVGDWLIATGARTKYRLQGHLMYAMQVDETLTFDAYWGDCRFLRKRPVLNGSLQQVYGDNIYHRVRGKWVQADSHHSLAAGRTNVTNLEKDTSTDRVLMARRFAYFGSEARPIPPRLRQFGREAEDVCCPARNHRVLSPELAKAFLDWLVGLDAWGLQGLPLEFTGQTHLQPASPPGLAVGRPRPPATPASRPR